ncbi:MAG: metalloregulator ArsR/SmtB family transcription factor [Thermoanaerobaculia bacterium]|nr:metalloregulator ArsR/SmtB family transcription factor [Thermoanaerobaculia bacterium]
MAKSRSDSGAVLDRLVATAKGLAHPARLRLLGMLATGELCVCQLTAVLELAPSTVSQHLAVLARGALVGERKEGKLVFYRLREGGEAAALLAPLLERLAGDPQAKADRALIARLRRVPIATLCAAELDLVAIGVRQPAVAAGAGADGR